MQTKNIKNRGYTLIELLLYSSVMIVIFLAISTFFVITLQSRAKNEAIMEVEQQGMQIMQLITQTIRNSEGINSPAQASSSSSLSLDVVDVAKDPTVFDLNGGVVYIKEGSGQLVSLNSSVVTASNLNFSNLSRPSTNGIIWVQFTLSCLNPQGKAEYDYTKTFYGSASLR